MVGNYMVPNAVMELLEPYRRPPGSPDGHLHRCGVIDYLVTGCGTV
jgi:hypothetical protein